MGDSPHPFAAMSPWVHSLEYGTIYGWSGLVTAIPEHFVVCDGTNGTPDLRDKFIPGAGNGFAVDETGGVSVHNHPFTGNGHFHNIAAGLDLGSGATKDFITTNNPAAGTTDNGSTLAPYYALIFLQLQR